jgi:hypothetical protein
MTAVRIVCVVTHEVGEVEDGDRKCFICLNCLNTALFIFVEYWSLTLNTVIVIVIVNITNIITSLHVLNAPYRVITDSYRKE